MSYKLTIFTAGILVLGVALAAPLLRSGDLEGSLDEVLNEIPEFQQLRELSQQARSTELIQELAQSDGDQGSTEGGNTAAEGEDAFERVEEDPTQVTPETLWAFYGITTLLIFGTIGFEGAKHALQMWVVGTPMQPLVNNLFSELTVLGFLGIISFLISKTCLPQISIIIFGHHEAEAQTMLGEMLEQIHMVIFFIMVTFLMEAVWVIFKMRSQQRDWTVLESSVLLPSGRVAAVREWVEASQQPFLWGERDWWGKGLSPRSIRYHKALDRVRFLTMRSDFIYFEDAEHPSGASRASASTGKLSKIGLSVEAKDHDELMDDAMAAEDWLEDATANADKDLSTHQHLRRQFSFYLYLTKVMGERLSHIVEIPGRQWFMLLVLIGVFCTMAYLANGSFFFILCLWLFIGWGLLAFCHFFARMLMSQLEAFQHDETPESLLEKITRQESLRGSSYTPVHKGRTTSGVATRPWIADSVPRYLDNSAAPPTGIYSWLCGEPANSKNPGQQKMFNTMTFGRNEVYFHTIVLRFLFLGTSVYISVFCYNVVPNYLAVVYPPTTAILYTVAGLFPVLLIVYYYIFEVVKDAVLLTSVEYMRMRGTADEVLRHQKEANCVSLMRLIAVIFSESEGHEPLDPNEVQLMTEHLTEDDASLMRGEPSSHVANYVGEYLADTDGKPNKAAELVMTRMVSIFDSVDKDRSGALSKAEIHMIFKEIGFDSPDAVDACLDPMLAHIAMPDSPAAATAAGNIGPAAAGASTDTASGGLFGCVAPSKDPGSAASKADDLSKDNKKHKHWDPMTKPVFLAWFLSVEKQARQLTAEQVAEIWFSLIDDDGSERLSVMELQEVLESCGKGFSANDMTQLILELDHNGDGEFDKHEFTMWIEKHNPEA